MTHYTCKKCLLRFFLLCTLTSALVPLFSSCAIRETARNRELLEQIRVGMTQEQVREIMGSPLTEESYHRPNLWYYYTRTQWFDGVITRDECTPFVFDEQGLLVGFGIEYLKKNTRIDY